MKTDCIERPISRAFAIYGRFVARHPLLFVIIPLVVAVACVAGLQFMELEIGIELLFTPEHGRAKKERSEIQRLFPDTDKNNFTSIRVSVEGELARFIVTPKNGKNLFVDDVIDEIKRLDTATRAITVDVDGHTYTYEDVCARRDGKCMPDPVLMLSSDFGIHPGQLHFPEQLIPVLNGPDISVFLGNTLSGVSRSATGKTEAKAWEVFYPMQMDHTAAEDWQYEFLQFLELRNFTHLKVFGFTTHALDLDMNDNAKSVQPLFAASFGILLLFSILSCLSDNWVRSKPVLATLGVVSAALAVGSGYGLMMHMRVPFNDVVGSGALLVLGIGLDDMYVILAAWRHTDPKLSIEGRMSIAFQEAGLSISITTLTNILCLCVGALSDLRSVKLFCLYSGVAITFDYLFILTFFAGCVVYTGRREEKGHHALTCHKVISKSQAGDRSALYRLFCTGGTDEKEDEKKSSHDSATVIFFRDILGAALSPGLVKIGLLVVYIIYLVMAMWGISRIGEGLQMKRLMADDSPASLFVDAEGDYFNVYGPTVQVAVNTELELWRPSEINKMNALLDRFQQGDALKYFYSAREEAWPELFTNFTDNKTLTESNVGDELENFLSQPAYRDFRLDMGDVVNGRLKRCRMFVRMRGVDVRVPDADAMVEARDIADDTMDLEVTVFNPSFILADQFLIILPSTIQNIAVATVTMFFISLMLIPHPICAFWVTLSVLSVCTGVTGYMSWWGIDLDAIAMVLLLMCVGFSVSFSAHITYAFVLDSGDTGNKRMRNALATLGMPIVQGALSTILGMVVLSASGSYVFRTFFKVIFLVMVFGAIHGLIFLPVLLSLVGPKGTSTATTSMVKVTPIPEDGERVMSRQSVVTGPPTSAQRDQRTPPLVGKPTPASDYDEEEGCTESDGGALKRDTPSRTSTGSNGSRLCNHE